jgi:predicted peptidase
MKTFIFSLASVLLLMIVAQAEKLDDGFASYVPVTLGDSSKTAFNYRWRAPDKVEPGNKYPLLFFLHGAGGRGNDNKGQLNDAGGIKAFAKQGLSTSRQSYVFAGQVPNGQRWVDVHWGTLEHKMPKASKTMAMALEALETFIGNKTNQVDPDRIYVMGLSMGGYGTWDAIQRRGQKIAKLPVWAWHGDKDGVIKVSRSRDMIEAIKVAGGSPKYSEIKGRGHNAWTDVWNSNELWDWLYSQKRK